MDRFWVAVAQVLHDLGVITELLSANQDIRAAVPYIAAAFLVIWTPFLVWRLFPRRTGKDGGAVSERPEQADEPPATERRESVAARVRKDRVAAGDPKEALGSLRVRSEPAERVAATRLPAGGLDPLRPALAEAYMRLARERLASAKSAEDVEAARLHAWGAVAAAPGRADCREMLAAIEEAARLRIHETASESDRQAWTILRFTSDAPAQSILERSRHRIGRSVELSGWEPEELRGAALAHLTRPSRNLPLGLGGIPGPEAGEGAEFHTARVTAEAGDAEESGGNVAYMPSAGLELRRASGGGAGAVRFDARQAGRAQRVVSINGRQGEQGPQQPDRAGADAARDGASPAKEGMSETEADLRRLLEHRRSADSLGELHPRTLMTRANIAHEVGRQGRHAEAEAEFQALRPIFAASEELGETHPDTLAVWHNLAVEIARQGRYEDAESEFRALLAVLAGPGGPGAFHPLTLATRHDLATTIGAQGRYSEAEIVFRDVWETRCRAEGQGKDDPRTLWARTQMLHMAELREAQPVDDEAPATPTEDA